MDEEFEQVSEIKFTTKLDLDSEAMKEVETNDAEAQLASDLKILYDPLNPFGKDGETIVTVTIITEEVCEEVDLTHGTEETHSTNKPCDLDGATSRRRRSHKFKKALNWVADTAKQAVDQAANIAKFLVEKRTAVVKVVFKPIGLDETVAKWSEKQGNFLINKIQEITNRVIDEAVNFVEDKKNFVVNSVKNTLCRLGQGTKYIANLLSKNQRTNNPTVTSTKAPDNKSFQLHKWMASLPDHMRELPLSKLSIPGTHDSGTYEMRQDYSIAQDSGFNKLNYLNYFKKVPSFMGVVGLYGGLKGTIAAWGQCVKHNIEQQLLIGIRYFDFR